MRRGRCSAIVSPASHSWSNSGHGYISKSKKDESNPDKASYNVDPKALEAIERSAGKPGFEVSIRLVVNAPTKGEAHTLLKQFTGTFSQFAGPYNKFVKQRIWLKRLFMVDFIYRYQAMFRGKSILNSEELATVFHFPNKQVETPHIHWLTQDRSSAVADPQLWTVSRKISIGVCRARFIFRQRQGAAYVSSVRPVRVNQNYSWI